MSKNSILIVIIILIALAIAGVGVIRYAETPMMVSWPYITSFEDCRRAGYLVMESYPRQCRSLNGKVFVEFISNSSNSSNSSNTSSSTSTSSSSNSFVTNSKCFVGGCSGQICSDQAGMMSTCEYREEYACYQNARCERQPSGLCGWTQTSELSACISSSAQTGGGIY